LTRLWIARGYLAAARSGLEGCRVRVDRCET
jgi:hypothetical protein